MIRVVIAEDHHLVRQGIRALLERVEDLTVVAEAADGIEALQAVETHRPDVLILDIAMPRLDGLQTLERVGKLGGRTQVVFLSMYADLMVVRAALRGGARGYLLKRAVKEELLLAVRAASRGGTYLSPEVSAALVGDLLAGPDRSGPFDHLTPREREVLQLVVEGHSNGEIGATLGISVKTVEKHRAGLMAKLGVHDVAGLVRIALTRGLVFPDR